MKKVLALVIALTMMISMSATALAANNFVSSVEQKTPTVDLSSSYVTDGNSNTVALEDIYATIVTTLNDTTSGWGIDSLTDENLAEYYDAVALLKDTYSSVKEATSLLDVIDDNDVLDSSKTYVCTDMIDVSFFGEAREVVNSAYAAGGSVTMTFDISAVANTQIYAAVYTDGAWVMLPASAVVNNNDGTVTVTFTADCPVMFIQQVDDAGEVVTSAQTSDVMPVYGIMAAVCLLAAASILVSLKKKTR